MYGPATPASCSWASLWGIQALLGVDLFHVLTYACCLRLDFGNRSSSCLQPVFLFALCDNYCVLFLATPQHLGPVWDSVVLTARWDTIADRKALSGTGASRLDWLALETPTLQCNWNLDSLWVKSEGLREKKIHIFFFALLWKHGWLQHSRWPRNSIWGRHQCFQCNQS